MAWWAWMLLGMVIASRFVRRRSWRWRAHHGNPWMRGGWGMVVMGDRRSRCGHGMRMQQQMWERQQEPQAPQPPVELTPSQKREQAIADLRRRYVADDITDEEYERELDTLLRQS